MTTTRLDRGFAGNREAPPMDAAGTRGTIDMLQEAIAKLESGEWLAINGLMEADIVRDRAREAAERSAWAIHTTTGNLKIVVYVRRVPN